MSRTRSSGEVAAIAPDVTTSAVAHTQSTQSERISRPGVQFSIEAWTGKRSME
jgi:hypothetical protein